jgi:hypothetical protein
VRPPWDHCLSYYNEPWHNSCSHPTIYQNKEHNCGNTKCNPIFPFFPQTAVLMDINQKLLIDMIICLFYTQLAQYPGYPIFHSTIKTFVGNDNRIKYLSSINTFSVSDTIPPQNPFNLFANSFIRIL